MPDIGIPETSGRIEIPAPLGVPHPNILTTLDHKLRSAHRSHIRVRVPERSIGLVMGFRKLTHASTPWLKGPSDLVVAAANSVTASAIWSISSSLSA